MCLYFKEDLSLRQIEILYFSWYIICELTIQNKVGNIVIYHTPNQSVTEFDDFLVNFEKLLNHVRQLKSTFLLILGDFNARSKSWWCEDITSHKGPQIESLTMSLITAVSIWPNTPSAQFIILYWSNFYGPTKLDSWQWGSSFLTSQMSSSDNLL